VVAVSPLSRCQLQPACAGLCVAGSAWAVRQAGACLSPALPRPGLRTTDVSRSAGVLCHPGLCCRGHLPAMHWKWWSKPCRCLRGVGFWGWRGAALVRQHILYPGQDSERLLRRGHVDRCYEREQCAVHRRFAVLERMTPGCDLRSHLRVVAAEFPDSSAQCPKVLRSSPPFYGHWCRDST